MIADASCLSGERSPPEVVWAFDTTGPWVALAALEGGDICFARHAEVRLKHNEVLRRLTQDLQKACGPGTPQTIALCVGPGSFTGTHVGAAFVLGLAEACGAGVVTVSSFEVAACLAPAESSRIAVAMPVVQDIWCRAILVRCRSRRMRLSKSGWSRRLGGDLEKTWKIP